MASTPQYASIPRIGFGKLSTANTNLNGTGTLVTVFTAGSSGSRIDQILVKATNTVTTGLVRFFLTDSTEVLLLTEMNIVPVTYSDSVATFEDGLKIDLILPNGWSIVAATVKNETFNVFVLGGDF